MQYKSLDLEGLYKLKIEPHTDERGFFARTFCRRELSKIGIDFEIVQTNISVNQNKHTLRGLHFQKSPHQEKKIVRCTKGAIFDVAVDIRPKSKTFLQWFATELSESNYQALLIPEGFAHGFLTLSEETEVLYFMSEYYSPESTAGYRWNDPAFKIDWPTDKNLIISDKDQELPLFQE